MVTVGAWSPLAAVGMPVQVKGRQGRVPGVVGAVPPHHQTPGQEARMPRWEEIWIDVGGGSSAAVAELGIRTGDLVVPSAGFDLLCGGRVLRGKAWDNRVGCGLLVDALLEAASAESPANVQGAVTVQEEVGARGAQAVAGYVHADVAIILEGPPADDLPSSADWSRQGAMGGGVQIRAFDPSMVASPPLFRLALGLAEREGIPHQIAVRRSGGTDAGPLHRAPGGIPAVVLGVPVRYAHSGVGLIHLDDYEACLRLIRSLLGVLDREGVDGLRP